MERDIDTEIAERWVRFVFGEDDHTHVPRELTDPVDHKRFFTEVRYLKLFAVEFCASGQPVQTGWLIRPPSIPERQRALRTFHEIVSSRPDGPRLQTELNRRLPTYWEAARAALGDENQDVVPRVGEAFARLIPGTTAHEKNVEFYALVCFNEFMKHLG